MRLFGKITRTVKFCDRGFRIYKRGSLRETQLRSASTQIAGSVHVDGPGGSSRRDRAWKNRLAMRPEGAHLR